MWSTFCSQYGRSHLHNPQSQVLPCNLQVREAKEGPRLRQQCKKASCSDLVWSVLHFLSRVFNRPRVGNSSDFRQSICTGKCLTALAIRDHLSLSVQPRIRGCLKCPVPEIRCSWRTPGVSAAWPSKWREGQLVRPHSYLLQSFGVAVLDTHQRIWLHGGNLGIFDGPIVTGLLSWNGVGAGGWRRQVKEFSLVLLRWWPWQCVSHPFYWILPCCFLTMDLKHKHRDSTTAVF